MERLPGLSRCFATAAAALILLSSCDNPNAPADIKPLPEEAAPPDPQLELTALSTSTRVLSAAEAAGAALWDAAWRVVPVMPASSLRTRLAGELFQAVIYALASDWKRLRLSLDQTAALLERYAATVPSTQSADVDSVRLALGAARDLIPT